MRKKFKFKKNRRKAFLFFVLVLVIYIVFEFCFTYFRKIELSSDNAEFIKKIINSSNHYLKYETNDSSLTKMTNWFLKADFSNPITLVLKKSDYTSDLKEEVVFMVGDNDIFSNNLVYSPRVYIYNSHQSEQYGDDGYEKYGLDSGVLMASYLLKEKLNDLNIETIMEEGNIVEFMRVNSYNHSYSYVASRYFIEPVILENNFDLIIDLHRDSNNKNSSTVNINGKNYAKILFVVGLENENYSENLELANKLNNIILKKYPTLTRGIYKKEGPGVDGVYNQDLSSNMILLEVGGYQNTESEVNNTLDIMALVIKEYLESL